LVSFRSSLENKELDQLLAMVYWQDVPDDLRAMWRDAFRFTMDHMGDRGVTKLALNPSDDGLSLWPRRHFQGRKLAFNLRPSHRLVGEYHNAALPSSPGRFNFPVARQGKRLVICGFVYAPHPAPVTTQQAPAWLSEDSKTYKLEPWAKVTIFVSSKETVEIDATRVQPETMPPDPCFMIKDMNTGIYMTTNTDVNMQFISVKGRAEIALSSISDSSIEVELTKVEAENR